MRKAFSDTLVSVAKKDPKLIFLTGDLGFQVFDDFIASFPDRYINVGVAEAQLINTAVGLALEGWRPVALGRTGPTNADQAPYGGDCFNASFSSDGAHKFFMHMNNNDGTTDVPFVATGSCSETDENLNNTDQTKIDPTVWPEEIGDGLSDVPPNDTDANSPSGVLWTKTDVVSGSKAQYCIPNVPTGNYTVGIYHNDSDDIISGIQLCEKCDSSDSGYPYYGTSLNQCENKTDPLEVPGGCE